MKWMRIEARRCIGVSKVLPLNKKLHLVLIGLASSLTFALAINTVFARWQRAGELAGTIDLYFYKLFFKPLRSPHPKLLIIDSNDREERRARDHYAQMIDTLRQAGAKIVAIDIRFLGVRDRPGDSALVQSVGRFPGVILSMDFGSPHSPSDWALAEMGRLALPPAACDTLIPKIVAESGVDLPFDSLLAAARHLGHINSTSGQYHHFPAVIRFGDSCYASLPLEIARLYFSSSSGAGGDTSSNHGMTDAEEDHSAFRQAQLPLDKDGQVLVNFIEASIWQKNRQNFFTWEGAFEVIRHDQAHRFRGAAVLLINSAAETLIDSPMGPYPRWAMLASLASQMLSHRHLDTSVLFVPALLSALISGVGIFSFLFVAPRFGRKWRKTRIVFISGSAVFLLLILFALRASQLWVGVVVPLLVYNTSLLVVRQRYYRMIRPARYVGFGLAILERKADVYPIKIFEAPGGSEEGDLNFNAEFLHHKGFHAALDRIWALQANENDLKLVGSKLFDALFPQEAFHILKNSLEQIQREGKNLRLVLHIDPPELVRLPWELMRSAKLPPGRVVMNRHLSLVRYLPLARPFRRKSYRVPLNILAMVSSPAELPPLDLASEQARIKKALRLMTWGGDVRLRFCEHATLDKLRNELERGPDVLHFIGHCDYDEKGQSSFLEFETEDGGRDTVSAETLGEVLHDSSVRLVVLNSCESAAASPHNAFTGVAQKLVNIGVPAVIAMQFKILDATAQLFSEAFYSALITNYSIEAALASARLRLMSGERKDLLGWATPVLYMRASDGEIFKMEK